MAESGGDGEETGDARWPGMGIAKSARPQPALPPALLITRRGQTRVGLRAPLHPSDRSLSIETPRMNSVVRPAAGRVSSATKGNPKFFLFLPCTQKRTGTWPHDALHSRQPGLESRPSGKRVTRHDGGRGRDMSLGAAGVFRAQHSLVEHSRATGRQERGGVAGPEAEPGMSSSLFSCPLPLQRGSSWHGARPLRLGRTRGVRDAGVSASAVLVVGDLFLPERVNLCLDLVVRLRRGRRVALLDVELLGRLLQSSGGLFMRQLCLVERLGVLVLVGDGGLVALHREKRRVSWKCKKG